MRTFIVQLQAAPPWSDLHQMNLINLDSTFVIIKMRWNNVRNFPRILQICVFCGSNPVTGATLTLATQNCYGVWYMIEERHVHWKMYKSVHPFQRKCAGRQTDGTTKWIRYTAPYYIWRRYNCFARWLHSAEYTHTPRSPWTQDFRGHRYSLSKILGILFKIF